MKFLSWILFILSLCGCVPTIYGQARFESAESHKKLKNSCLELESVGDYRVLIAQIKTDMNEVNNLLKKDNFTSNEPRLMLLGKQLQGNADRLKRISDPKYSQAMEDQEIQWSIKLPVADDSLNSSSENWKEVQVEIEDLQTEDSLNLIGSADFQKSTSDGRVLVTLKRKASLLDLCQFQGAMVAGVAVTLKNEESVQTLRYLLRMRGEQL